MFMRNVIVFGSLLSLVACSSPNPDEIVRKVGVVEASEIADSATAELTAYFVGIADGAPAATVRANFLPFNSTCTVEAVEEAEDGSTETDDGTVDAFGVSGSPISAGDVLTVSSPAGSFTELTRADSDSYTGNPLPQYPLPAGLTIDIPGAEYPAFTSIAIPDASQLILEVPAADEMLTTDTVLTWQANNDVDSMILLSADVVNADPEIPDSKLSCVLADTGSFEFSETTKTQLGSDFTTADFEMNRESKVFIQDDDVILLLSHSLK